MSRGSIPRARVLAGAVAALATWAGLAPVPPCRADDERPAPLTVGRGVRVVLSGRPGQPLATVALFVRSGRADDPPGLEGAAEVIATLLGDQVVHDVLDDSVPPLSARGVVISKRCDEDAIYLGLTGPASSAPELAQALGRLAAHPPRPEQVAAAVAAVRADLEARRASPAETLSQRLTHLAFTMHPYRRHALDALDGLGRLTTEAVRDELRRRLGAENLVLVAAGGVDPSGVATAAALAFADVPAGPGAGRYLIVEPKTVEPRVSIEPGAFPRTRVAVGFLAPPARSADAAAAAVLAELLSTDTQAARDLLAALPPGTELWARAEPRRDPWLFTIETVGPPVDPRAVRAAVVSVLRRACSGGASLVELARARERLRLRTLARRRTSAGLALDAGERATRDVAHGSDPLAALAEVQGEALERFARDYLTLEASCLAAQTRLLLPERAPLDPAPVLRPVEVLVTSAGPRLALATGDFGDLVAWEVVVPRPVAPGALRSALAAELARASALPEDDSAAPAVPTVALPPDGPREPADLVRASFAGAPADFSQTFARSMAAVARALAASGVPPARVVVAVAAAAPDPDVCRTAMERAFAPPAATPAPAAAPTAFAAEPGAPPPGVTVAGPAPGAGTALEAAALVAAELLGTRLLVADEGRTPLGAPEAWYLPSSNGGRLVLSARCPVGQADEAARALSAEVRRLALDSPPAGEVAAAAAAVRVRLTSQALDPRGRATQAATEAVRGGGPDATLRLYEALGAVTPAAVVEVARQASAGLARS